MPATMMRWIKLVRLFTTVLAVFPSVALFAQDPAVLTGQILSTADKNPVAQAAVVLVEAGAHTTSDVSGRYSLVVHEKGAYTLMVSAAGFTPLRMKLTVGRDSSRDFWLRPAADAGVTVVGRRDIQAVSRNTMTADELKSVPGTLGDPIGALASLPGVARTGDFIGYLAMRGAPDYLNGYYIDGIPLIVPQHFSGFHAVIPNVFVKEVDMFSSAFPARYGGASAAMINMNTIDDVSGFGGWADIGLISATAMLKIPITAKSLKDENYIKENRGYVIVGGRYGYLAWVVPLLYDALAGQSLGITPEYWDYQVKAKYSFNTRHSLTLLALGSGDYLRLSYGESDDAAADPLAGDNRLGMNMKCFTQGLTYAYRQGKRLSNDLLAYASLCIIRRFLDYGDPSLPDWSDYTENARPSIYGLRDTLRFKWLGDTAEILVGAEVALYDFVSHGENLVLKNFFISRSMPDFADEDACVKVAISPVLNVLIGGFLENRFTYGGLTVVPGLRVDYLERSNIIVADPRLFVSYEFKTDTAISIAGGMYSSFYQVNPYYFDYLQYVSEIGSGLEPARSVHSALGLEQKVFIFTIRAEGFFNYFWDMGVSSAYLDNYFDNTGKLMACGAELSLRVEHSSRSKGFSGLVSYAYTRAKFRSGLSDEYDGAVKVVWGGDRFVSCDYEKEHVFKFVLEYTYKKHSISAKFQLNSSFPYTPITGSDESPDGSGRYVPTYYGAGINSRHYPVNHRLDLRYTYTSRHEWGQVSWYIELINAYYSMPVSAESWRYDRPYRDGRNPKPGADPYAFGLVPNFGVEVEF
ncbi:MAG TPA: carboxypeptidase-like regulatory domain-containing protein [Spirochaetota bacterium]|nr:carboxypeptidase-like regulatory domain-containing protein [Spirochaetota bacterium]HSA14881.1 carboxypeptidase-like regulatory domain-containing protein [Spirochaetota bacterium]